MNWIKTTSIIPTWQTLGDYLNNQLFEIIGSRYSGFTLTTRIGNDHSNEIGKFKTLEKAQIVADLIDKGEV